MLSEEEKKAINNLNFIIVTDIYDNEVRINKTEIVNEYNHSVGIVLNLTTKLQKENEEKDNKVRKIIDRLDNDYKRITETKSDGNHWDDYSKCRLKAYRTKTREIKEYIEKQYFETKAKKGE